jgi:small-conductance mechanosensitive channel
MMEWLLNYLDSDKFFALMQAGILFLSGFFIAGLLGRTVYRVSLKRFNTHHATLSRRLVYWLVLGLFIASGLKQLGFNLGVLLGAAGVLSVAIGFASQTSVSNLISGLFLIGERPFQIGDTIEVGSTKGEILSIDLLSVKIRTADNLFVRIPNESLIKTSVTNLTRFPIRRLDLKFGVAYKENINQVRQVLLQVAEQNPLSLDEPGPLFQFLSFGDSSLDLQFSVWTKKENYTSLQTSLLDEIKKAFDQQGIELPFPQRELSLNADTLQVLKDGQNNRIHTLTDKS